MNGQRVAYRRVSTSDQSTERQLDGMCFDREFSDHASGKDTNRPGLLEAMAYLRAGDTMVIHSLDRLGRNIVDLRNIVDTLTKKGVVVEFVKERLTFTGDDSPMASLLLNLLGSVAQFERALLLERQREGIAIAKRKGLYRGRKHKLTPEQVQELRGKVTSGCSKAQVAREYGLSRQSLYNYLGA